MATSADQARLDDLIARTGLKDGQVGRVLGVSQPTVSRLKNGKIKTLAKYIAALEDHLGLQSNGITDAELITDLAGYARRVPALRETLVSLHTLMRGSA